MKLAAPAWMLLAACGRAAAAGEAAPAPAPLDLAPSLVQMTLGLAFVVALIYAATWLLRRAQPGCRGSSLLKVVASLSVGQRERVVIVECGDQWLVVGVATGGLSTLHTMPKGELPVPAAANSFAGLLAAARGSRPK
ncbi:MAG: flagellar biosynthetic protein FliO [Burkholderiales bacterium]